MYVLCCAVCVKAVSLEDKDVKGDKNAKDFILFFHADYRVLRTDKDNTGRRTYIEGMVFPTLSFPSDHGQSVTASWLWVVALQSPSLLCACMYVCRYHLDGAGGAAAAGPLT